jgi:hypothetical protein
VDFKKEHQNLISQILVDCIEFIVEWAKFNAGAAAVIDFRHFMKINLPDKLLCFGIDKNDLFSSNANYVRIIRLFIIDGKESQQMEIFQWLPTNL